MRQTVRLDHREKGMDRNHTPNKRAFGRATSEMSPPSPPSPRIGSVALSATTGSGLVTVPKQFEGRKCGEVQRVSYHAKGYCCAETAIYTYATGTSSVGARGVAARRRSLIAHSKRTVRSAVRARQ